MKNLYRLFPALAKRRAIKIAIRHCFPETDQFQHFTQSIDQLNIHNKPTEPCWLISTPWLDGKGESTLRSTRIIMISKATGKVVYDGSAHEEG